MAGLVDRYVARAPGPSCQKDYDLDYVLDQEPDFIVLTLHFLPGRRMAANDRFRTAYKFVAGEPGHYLFERIGGESTERDVTRKPWRFQHPVSTENQCFK